MESFCRRPARSSRGELVRLRLEGLTFLNRLLSGEATQRDATELSRWRGRSPTHEAAFRSAVRLRRLIRQSLSGALREGALNRKGGVEGGRSAMVRSREEFDQQDGPAD
ncbi:FecR/PupR family sigma factor regulator [Sphingomonas sp. QA11]|uniref:FecR/PupR family sigma factor regulator n=1 Tax=Sphingomonas sp. QA11 TaxID=2950605 RepID=UPI0023493022|nr:FecR/PupR family sigma factor regulator [Sphingomonas sp. QA11]WCM29726.1 FecR/PupR family sigma factor regulator [Sphingomonas sp. QA11]